jgi:signal peptidase I
MPAWLRDNRGLIAALLLFGVFRTAVADYNPIPSGSMRPTLIEGDVVLVDRLAYDLRLPLGERSLAALGEPARGDVVTFFSPLDGTRLIKRVVGLPGDTVSLRGGVLGVNGQAAVYEDIERLADRPASGRALDAVRATEIVAGDRRRVQYALRRSARGDFAPTVVPPGHYFMLGDNRDDSADSRVVGPVPRRLLIGRAHHLLLSADPSRGLALRTERSGLRID